MLDKLTNVIHNDVMANRVIDKNGGVVRAAISFAHEIYGSLEEIASAKKVSIAWVVRDAVESYLTAPVKTDRIPDATAFVLEKQGHV